ncbi:MAG: sigma-70 family RNA polymerase sigma factor [Thermodesulfobacteriota bacterium]
MKSSQLTDVEGLVRRVNQGDRHAWNEFYARYFRMILCAVKKYVRPGSDEEADLVQEVFIALFSALKGYDPSRPIEGYILEIARRVRISLHRREVAAKRGGGNPNPLPLSTHDSSQEQDCITVPSHADDPESSLIKAQERHLLKKALDVLTDSCRELLGLRYDQGLPYQEIATRLAVKEGTLRVRMQRCLATLARTFAGLEAGREDSR